MNDRTAKRCCALGGGADGGKIKPSARHALEQSDVLYLSSLAGHGFDARKQFDEWRTSLKIDLDFDSLPILTREDLRQVISLLRKTGSRSHAIRRCVSADRMDLCGDQSIPIAFYPPLAKTRN
jgi:hypothetical protein